MVEDSFINLCSAQHLNKFKLNIQQADNFSDVSSKLKILTGQSGVKHLQIKMTKSKANLNELLVKMNTLNFENMVLKFNTVEANASLASVLFTSKQSLVPNVTEE